MFFFGAALLHILIDSVPSHLGAAQDHCSLSHIYPLSSCCLPALLKATLSIDVDREESYFEDLKCYSTGLKVTYCVCDVCVLAN